jgi:hypothetical protein
MQAVQLQAMKGMTAPRVGQAALLAGAPDAQVMIAFQQDMMQVAMDATSGNAVARAKLDAWQKLSESFEADAAKLSGPAAAGDMAAYAKLQQLQVGVMREWLDRYGSKAAKASIKP